LCYQSQISKSLRKNRRNLNLKQSSERGLSSNRAETCEQGSKPRLARIKAKSVSKPIWGKWLASRSNWLVVLIH
jgi:hypothetical protein